MKRCRKCGQDKSHDQFSLKPRNRDGLRHECRECERQRKRELRAANPEAGRQRSRRYRQAHRDRMAIRQAAYRKKVRAKVLGYYGQTCACCGSAERLTIDHVNGDGKQHREQLFGPVRTASSVQIYAWLIREGFPDGFQTLCLQCNNSKGTGERCRLVHLPGGLTRRRVGKGTFVAS